MTEQQLGRQAVTAALGFSWRWKQNGVSPAQFCSRSRAPALPLHGPKPRPTHSQHGGLLAETQTDTCTNASDTGREEKGSPARDLILPGSEQL